jgi:hypothetical protein
LTKVKTVADPSEAIAVLNRYGYPPDLQAETVKTVLEQAKFLCADWAVTDG